MKTAEQLAHEATQALTAHYGQELMDALGKTQSGELAPWTARRARSFGLQEAAAIATIAMFILEASSFVMEAYRKLKDRQAVKREAEHAFAGHGRISAADRDSVITALIDQLETEPASTALAQRSCCERP